MDYNKASDQLIFEAREKVKNKFGLDIYEFIDQYPLFACPQTMLRVNKNFHYLNAELLSKREKLFGNGIFKWFNLINKISS